MMETNLKAKADTIIDELTREELITMLSRYMAYSRQTRDKNSPEQLCRLSTNIHRILVRLAKMNQKILAV